MKRNLIRLKHFYNDPDKKPFFTIVKEVFKLWTLKKAFPAHYFGRFFYRTNAPKNINDYMSIQEYNRINEFVAYKNLSRQTIYQLLHNKLFFYFHCIEHEIPTPKVISYNFRESFFFNKQTFNVQSVSELVDYFLMVFQTENINSLFLKPIQGSGGYGAILLNEVTIREQSSQTLKALINDSYIHQEVVIQHNEINRIYHKSINTIRLETFLDKKNKIHLLGGIMRFGSGNSVVDNISRGGFFVNINLDEGKLFKNAKTSMISGSWSNTKHPDSGFVFEDFKIPFFDEALRLVIHASKLMPSYLQGWDIAITEYGPIIIEGNYSPGLLYAEFSYHGYKNNPIFKAILNDTKAYHKAK